jgi:hypothetical protein
LPNALLSIRNDRSQTNAKQKILPHKAVANQYLGDETNLNKQALTKHAIQQCISFLQCQSFSPNGISQQHPSQTTTLSTQKQSSANTIQCSIVVVVAIPIPTRDS